MRPIDIARRLGVSTTTIRHYERMEMIPPVQRVPSGHRQYTGEHLAYFSCIRDMMPAFPLSHIAKMLGYVMAHDFASALWEVNQAQAELHNDKLITEKIRLALLEKRPSPSRNGETYSVQELSEMTGIRPTTIRYWDKVGLLSAHRSPDNNYRVFTPEHIEQILTIYALKLSLSAQHQKHSIEQIRLDMDLLDLSDVNKSAAMIASIEVHLYEVNRKQIKAASALYDLCCMVEIGCYDT